MKQQERPLHKQYRYSQQYGGFVEDTIVIMPVGIDDPREQNYFHYEVQLLTIALFGEGYAADAIYTSQPPVVFQHPDMTVNKRKAQQVMKKWRELKKRGVNIMHEYRQYSLVYKYLNKKR